MKSTINYNNEWYICKLLMNYVLGKRILNILNHVIFPAKIQISKPIDVPYIRVYVWLKDDKHVIWMWIWLILKNISLLDIIWSLWLVRFAHSPTNFIFWLDSLIFSVSINSHPDNIYLSSFPPAISTCWLHKQNLYQSSHELSRTYQQSAGVITKFSQHLNKNSCEDNQSK